jgi:hypothetical protein
MVEKQRKYGLSLTPQGVKKFLTSLLKREAGKVPAVFLWGPPGIGKSSIVKQVAKERGIEIIDLRLSLLDAIDLRGIPSVKDDKCFWTRPPFLPDKGEGILFLDELNTASPSVQNSALQLVLDRRVGEHKLGEGWYIISAGNRLEDSSLVFQLADPLISRFVHVEVQPSVDEWIAWAMKNDIDEKIVGFIKFRPDLLLKIDENRNSINFPCPRSWEFASVLMKTGVDPVEAVESSAGTGVSAEFNGWLKVYDKLPDVEEILDGKKELELSKYEVSVLCAMGPVLVQKADTSQRLENLLKILTDIEDRRWGVYFATLMFARFEKDKIVKCKNWKGFFVKYSDILFEEV